MGVQVDLSREADAFCIWREGKPIRWDCTVSEMAEAVGLPLEDVKDICRERRWPIQKDAEDKDAEW